MKVTSLAVAGTLFSLTAFGQDLLQCVNPDILNGLIYRGRSEARLTITPGLPESMAGFEAPADFELIGTAVRGNTGTTTVAYATELASAAAHAAFFASLQADGWAVEDDPLGPPIFSLTDGPETGTLCLNGERRMLSVLDANGTRYVRISINDQEQERACNEADRALSMMQSGIMGMFMREMPSLEFPAGTRSASPDGRLNGGRGASGENFHTAVQVVSAETPQSLIDDLGAQMSELGWRVDSSWSGRVSTGARWTRTTDDATPFWTSIEIVRIDDFTYDVNLRLTMPPF